MYLGILDLLALGVARMWRESRRGLDWIRRRVDPGGEALMSLGILDLVGRSWRLGIEVGIEEGFGALGAPGAFGALKSLEASSVATWSLR